MDGARGAGLARSRPRRPLSTPSLMPAGPEFVLADAQEPHLFVIRRQLRGAPGAAPVPQAVYYILDGSVYQAPTLEAVLSARLVREGGGLGFFFFVLPFRPSSPLSSPEPVPVVDAHRVSAHAGRPGPAAAGGAGGGRRGGAPPRRYSDAERERARTGDRIVSTVLATMLPQGGDGGSAAAAGGGMDAGE